MRRTAEKCDSLDGFILYFSPLGGTGGGLGGTISEDIVREYGRKITKISVEIVSN